MSYVDLTILGEPASKANQRQLVKFGKRMVSIKSKKALAYERAALLQIPPGARAMFAGPVRVTLHIWYASQRPDLDESVVLDVLQARYKVIDGVRTLVHAGVYVNDRQVREKHVFHHIDPQRPRAEVRVDELEPSLFAGLPITTRKHAPMPQTRLKLQPGEDPF